MITAIITCYFPNKEVIENLHKIANQVERIIVTDNSDVDNRLMFKELPNNFHYVPNKQNLGLSKAFNSILKDKKFNWQNDDFVIFFDQDSKIEENYIQVLIDTYHYLVDNGTAVGCLGPVYFNTSSNCIEIPRNKQLVSKGVYRVNTIITSSMLIQYKNLKKIDYWNEDVFLDMADWDICWRLNNIGLFCYMTDLVVLNHTLGQGEKNILGIKLRIGAPIREYYQIRDCQYLLRKDYVPLKFKIRFLLMITIRSWLHIAFLDNSDERSYYIKLAKFDFKNNIHGALRDSHIYERNSRF